MRAVVSAVMNHDTKGFSPSFSSSFFFFFCGICTSQGLLFFPFSETCLQIFDEIPWTVARAVYTGRRNGNQIKELSAKGVEDITRRRSRRIKVKVKLSL
jgi:hypothetical protein